LKLELILTKDDNGAYHVHLDSKNNEFVPVKLLLKVDNSVLRRKWYERIMFFGLVNVGKGTLLWGGNVSAGAGYSITDKVSLGVNITSLYNGTFSLYYGAFVVYFPFIKN